MNLEHEIDKDFAKELCANMGYFLLPERIERIAVAARQTMKQGVPASSAFAEALEVDLLMYGDPKAYNPDEVVSGYEYL